MTISRRKFLGIAAGTGVGVLAAKTGAASEGKFKGYPGSKAVLHDSTLCIGCRSCEKACNTVNDLPAPERPFSDLSVLDEKRRTTAKEFTVVNRYHPDGEGQRPVTVKTQCNHCLEPTCATVCFVRAFTKTPEGAVVYDPTVCVGCRYCLMACPFYIPTYEYDSAFSPRVRKCTMCYPRVKEGKLPGCVEACPMEALYFGDREDVLKVAHDRLRKYPNRYVQHIFGETEAGGTSWLTIAGAPFEKLGFRDDVGTVSGPELNHTALAAVPMVIGLWPVALVGFYAISQRKDKISRKEKAQALREAIAETRDEEQKKAKAAADRAATQKQKEIDNAVKKALAEAEKARAAEESQKEGS